MGWLFTYANYSSAKEYAETEIIKKNGDRVIKHRLVGNHLWMLYKGDSGKKLIVLCLIQKSEGQYGYKDIDETMGPYYYDCPLSFIKEADEPYNDSARNWREKVKKHHANKKEKKETFAAGMKIKYGNHAYTLMEYLGRKGWSIVREDGEKFRMPNTRMKDCELIAQ